MKVEYIINTMFFAIDETKYYEITNYIHYYQLFF